jgi:hypothetical protein
LNNAISSICWKASFPSYCLQDAKFLIGEHIAIHIARDSMFKNIFETGDFYFHEEARNPT